MRPQTAFSSSRLFSLRDERGSPGRSDPSALRPSLRTLMVIAVGTHYLVARSVLHRRAWFTLGQSQCHWLFLDAPGNQSSHSRVLTGDYGVACWGGSCHRGSKKSPTRSPSAAGGASVRSSAYFAAFFMSPARR